MAKATKVPDDAKADMLEKAGTLFQRVTSQLYTAAQAAQDGDHENADKHLDHAMQHQEKAQEILNKL